MSDQKILGLGFIGLGQAVARMFQQYPQGSRNWPYKVVAAAEPREEARVQFGKDFDGHAYSTPEDMCRDPQVDVVYVATPPEMHRAHVEIAARHGKHVIVEKPMALSLEDCQAMIECCERHQVKLLAGHTHSFDAPIRKIREIVTSGELGKLVMINSWNYNDFNARPWPTAELAASFGPILNQGPHHVDIARQIAGGMVRTVRAQKFWDGMRNVVGGYNCFLEFENGVSSNLVYDGRSFFDTSELFWWVSEAGAFREPDSNLMMIRNFRKHGHLTPSEREAELERQKDQGRYGAGEIDPETWKLWGYDPPEDVVNQPFFGLTIVSFEKGAIRQTKHGLLIYGEDGKREISLQDEMRGRAAELMDLYHGVVHGKPIFHDGNWGMATLEVCLAMIDSAEQRRELVMSRQVPMPN
jgi:phthalate 4,5-cis-dihydrodiol dehydrogenase